MHGWKIPGDPGPTNARMNCRLLRQRSALAGQGPCQGSSGARARDLSEAANVRLGSETHLAGLVSGEHYRDRRDQHSKAENHEREELDIGAGRSASGHLEILFRLCGAALDCQTWPAVSV